MKDVNTLPARHGYAWRKAEEGRLRAEVAAGLDKWLIAENHQRTLYAIECAVERYRVELPASFNVSSGRTDHTTPAESLILNGVDYLAKFELARKVIASVINGDTKAVRFGNKIWSEIKI